MNDPFERMGDAAWRLRVPDLAAPRALLDALRGVRGVVDAIVTERHALVTFDPADPPQREDLARAVAVARRGEPANGLRRHVVRVTYDGPDLDELARALSLGREELVALHAAPTYVVATLGFLPGFAYLRGLDARLVAPRRATPRVTVPPLSVAIAGPYSGIYPFASPGGWNLVGTALGFAPFDPLSGATLTLGDEVRFVPEAT